MITENTPVWFIHQGELQNGFIFKHHEATARAAEYYDIHMTIGGIVGAMPENIFLCQEDAIQEINRRSNHNVEAYMAKINSVEDLVQFMYTHTVAPCEEYTDWDARTAVVQKAALFGIHLSDN